MSVGKLSSSYYALQLQGVQAYLDKEVVRRNFVVARWNFREEEKREIEMENKKKMGVSRSNSLYLHNRTAVRSGAGTPQVP